MPLSSHSMSAGEGPGTTDCSLMYLHMTARATFKEFRRQLLRPYSSCAHELVPLMSGTAQEPNMDDDQACWSALGWSCVSDREVASSNKILLAVDHSARTSMKSAANCVTWCELQDTLIIDNSNANGGQGLLGFGCVRLRVG